MTEYNVWPPRLKRTNQNPVELVSGLDVKESFAESPAMMTGHAKDDAAEERRRIESSFSTGKKYLCKSVSCCAGEVREVLNAVRFIFIVVPV